MFLNFVFPTFVSNAPANNSGANQHCVTIDRRTSSSYYKRWSDKQCDRELARPGWIQAKKLLYTVCCREHDFGFGFQRFRILSHVELGFEVGFWQFFRGVWVFDSIWISNGEFSSPFPVEIRFKIYDLWRIMKFRFWNWILHQNLFLNHQIRHKISICIFFVLCNFWISFSRHFYPMRPGQSSALILWAKSSYQYPRQYHPYKSAHWMR